MPCARLKMCYVLYCITLIESSAGLKDEGHRLYVDLNKRLFNGSLDV